MNLTDRLYEAAKPIWDGYLNQPFVKELGEGTKPVCQGFRHGCGENRGGTPDDPFLLYGA